MQLCKRYGLPTYAIQLPPNAHCTPCTHRFPRLATHPSPGHPPSHTHPDGLEVATGGRGAQLLQRLLLRAAVGPERLQLCGELAFFDHLSHLIAADLHRAQHAKQGYAGPQRRPLASDKHGGAAALSLHVTLLLARLLRPVVEPVGLMGQLES